VLWLCAASRLRCWAVVTSAFDIIAVVGDT
jgi:hypothetical protein